MEGPYHKANYCPTNNNAKPSSSYIDPSTLASSFTTCSEIKAKIIDKGLG